MICADPFSALGNIESHVTGLCHEEISRLGEVNAAVAASP